MEHYENALLRAKSDGVAVKALVLCNPHNPLGKRIILIAYVYPLTMAGICYTPVVLQALSKLCQTYQIHIISDEVYALFVWHNKAAPHTSFSSLS